MTDREPLALECALLSAQASGVAREEDTLAALGLLQGQAVQRVPPVSDPIHLHMHACCLTAAGHLDLTPAACVRCCSHTGHG